MASDLFGIVGTLQAGAFRVESVVAEGGFAVVYRAHHEGFRAKVALKCLKIPGTFNDEQKESFLEKFRAEGELLFRLSALIPTVVRPLHVGTIESERRAFVPFIALEWLEGETLDSLLARRRKAGKPPLDLTRVVRLLGPVARALECAHAFPGPDGSKISILHRDLKPENLFVVKLAGHEVVKVLDFGIGTVKSVATQIAGRMSTEHGGLSAFTPAYGAPEQWLPKRFGQTGTWTDVWGLALCAVEALCGRAPLEGDVHAVMGACIDEQRRPTPRNTGAIVPDAVEAAFARALAVDPRRRYANVGEFWDRIEAAVGVHTPRIAAASVSESVAPPSAPGVVPDLSVPSLPHSAAPALRELEPDPSLLRNDVIELARSEPPPAKAEESKSEKAEGLQRTEIETAATSPLVPSAARAPNAARITLDPPRVTRHLMERLRPAFITLAIGIGSMIVDFVFAAISGAAFTLGPVRVFWIAGPLVVIGLFQLIYAVLSA